ncbi:MAG: hemerythrin family protein [Oscillospiraceae bacterium]|nr:hemerythrin family protein [Oscillospiraceae bacterium]
MTYELTQDLMTGNALIDSEHRQLFAAVNNLMTACSQGKGRDQIQQTVTFLSNYVVKHFQDEERLQAQSNYPNYSAHKQFHDGYRRQLAQVSQELLQEGPTVKALGDLNRVVAVLISHIRTEDKRLARHIKEN